jgi:GTP-binding protein Era
VEKNSQKGILIGREGRALKKVGELARKEMETFLNRPVFLELFVKVSENWRRNDDTLRELGY